MRKRQYFFLTPIFLAILFILSLISYSQSQQTSPICIVSGGFQPGQNYWVLSGNRLYPSSTAWNVGIGTTTPRTKLHIVAGSGGNFRIDSGDNNILYIGHDSDVGDWIQFRPENALGLAFLKGPDSPAMVVTKDGNVGIGTTNPQTKLQINAGSGEQGLDVFSSIDNARSFVRVRNTSKNIAVGLGADAANNMATVGFNASSSWGYFYMPIGDASIHLTTAGNVDVVRLGPTSHFRGNVGIGTTTPQAKLEVVGAIRLAPSSAPNNPQEGMMYYDSGERVFKCYVKDERGNITSQNCGGMGGPVRNVIPFQIFDSANNLVLEINQE